MNDLFTDIASIFTTSQDHSYTARFGNASEHFSYWNHGFSVGSRALTKSLSHTNFLCCGQTGSGKGSLVVIPSLVSLSRGKSSIVILDISSQNWNKTSKFFKQCKYNVQKVNFGDPFYSESFNFLDYCNTVSDIHKGVTLLYKNTNGESRGEIFWEQSCIMMLSMFGRFLKFHCDPKYCNVQNILRLVERFAIDDAVDRLFVRTNNDELLSAFKATVGMSERTLQSVISSCRASLNLWTDPAVCMSTCTSSIDFSKLRAEPTIIYCCTPLKDLEYLKPLTSLFFQQLFNHVLSSLPDENENTRSVFFILDEFGSCRFTNNFPSLISNSRKFSVGIQICVQDENIISAIYGQNQAHQITTNCACQCYLKGTPLHSASRISQQLGKYTYKDEKGIERTRELMTPSEIRMCDDALLLINSQLPLRVNATPYYKSLWLPHFDNVTPYRPEKKNVTENLPLIPFD